MQGNTGGPKRHLGRSEKNKKGKRKGKENNKKPIQKAAARKQNEGRAVFGERKAQLRRKKLREKHERKNGGKKVRLTALMSQVKKTAGKEKCRRRKY